MRARVKVVSTQGEPLSGALIRRDGSAEHDLARFTDDQGCAYFSGVVSPGRHVPVTIGKPGYESRSYKLGTLHENCIVVHLARDGEARDGSLDSVASQDCPCNTETGYSPTLSARFKVSATEGRPVAQVAVRRSDRRQRYPWSQVTDATGCLGVRWIVSAGLWTIPLVLERPEYLPAYLEVPTMEDRCYAVSLRPAGAAQASTVVALGNDECECQMFSGRIVWDK